MNPRERMLATWKGEKADRVPLELYGFWFGDREEVAGCPDPLRRRIAGRILHELPFRTKIDSYMNRLLVTPPQRIHERVEHLGGGRTRQHGTIDTPKGDLTYLSEWDPTSETSWMVKYPVESRADIEAIASVPWELPEALLRPPGTGGPKTTDIREPGKTPASDTPQDAADFLTRGICEVGISSPMVCVAGTMPYEDFLMLCATDLDLVRELTAICLERATDILKVLLSRPGVDIVWMGGSEWVTPPMGSPALYDALVQEQERALIDYVHAHSDAVVQVHCHGRVRHALARTIERGADYTEPVEPPPDGDITMAEAKALADGRITLGGNVESRVLANESEEVTEAAVRAAFEGGTERFVLVTSAGCSPEIADREFRNYMRLIDAWEELSPL